MWKIYNLQLSRKFIDYYNTNIELKNILLFCERINSSIEQFTKQLDFYQTVELKCPIANLIFKWIIHTL